MKKENKFYEILDIRLVYISEREMYESIFKIEDDSKYKYKNKIVSYGEKESCLEDLIKEFKHEFEYEISKRSFDKFRSILPIVLNKINNQRLIEFNKKTIKKMDYSVPSF